jgi:hypothetical protein
MSDKCFECDEPAPTTVKVTSTNCKVCGKLFDQGYYNKNGNWVNQRRIKMCSHKCREIEKDRNRTPAPKITKELKCQQCGCTYKATNYEKSLKTHKYCGDKCQKQATKEAQKSGKYQKASVKSFKTELTSRNFAIPHAIYFKPGETVKIPNYRFGLKDRCTYCGTLSERIDIDHCIAWSYISSNGEKRSNIKGITTYSCAKCNSKLNDRMFDTFIERMMFMRTYYSRVYSRFSTDWTYKTIKQENFDYTLETYVLDDYLHKEQCEKKIKWIKSNVFKEEIYDQVKFSVLHNLENFTSEQQAFLFEYFGLNNNFHTV